MLFISSRLCRACVECPPDWTHIELVGGCYKLLPRRLQWPVAGLGCRSLHEHAHLLVINSAQEQAAVAGFLASNSGRCTFIPGSPTQASQQTLHALFLAHDSRLYKTAQTAKSDSDIISSRFSSNSLAYRIRVYRC